MKPVGKSGEFEQFISDVFGIERAEAIEEEKCVAIPIGCGKAISDFRDSLSIEEYRISGLCQECQDRVFGK